jgi:hypothetical protein
MHRPFEKARWKKENPTIKPNQLDMPSVHQRAAFFCARHGHMRRGKRRR